MDEVSTQHIVVGVSEGDSEGALQYAVDEARRRHCGITIVHALSPTLPPPPGAPLIMHSGDVEKSAFFADRSESAEADRLVNELARKARAMGRGEVEVNTELPVGRRVHAIVEAAGNAPLIVLQHRDLPMFERIFIRSTSTAVSARSHCPVVTVPPDWDADVRHNRVTVGIDDLDESDEVLRVGFENAARRSARLNVVHAWKLMSADADVLVSRSLADEWQTRSERELAALLEQWKREFPDVTVEQHIAQQSPSHSLLEYSQDSDLLVLGRTRTALPLPLGSIARAMVKSAHCPVEVVPHSASPHQTPSEAGSHSESAR